MSKTAVRPTQRATAGDVGSVKIRDGRMLTIMRVKGDMLMPTIVKAPVLQPRPGLGMRGMIDDIASRLDDWHLDALLGAAIAALKHQRNVERGRARRRVES